MKIVRISFITLLTVLPLLLVAQATQPASTTTPNTTTNQATTTTQKVNPCKDTIAPMVSFFYGRDIIIGSKVFLLEVKEISRNGKVEYLFRLSGSGNNNSCKWFLMQDLNNTVYNQKTLATNIKARVEEITGVVADTLPKWAEDSILTWNRRITAANINYKAPSSGVIQWLDKKISAAQQEIVDGIGSLDEDEIQKLKELLNQTINEKNAALIYNDSLQTVERDSIHLAFNIPAKPIKIDSVKFNALFYPLSRYPEKDVQFIKALKAKSVLNSSDFIVTARKEIDLLAAAFLKEAYDIIYRKNQQAPVVGKLSIKSDKVSLYTNPSFQYDTTDDSHFHQINYAEKISPKQLKIATRYLMERINYREGYFEAELDSLSQPVKDTIKRARQGLVTDSDLKRQIKKWYSSHADNLLDYIIHESLYFARLPSSPVYDKNQKHLTIEIKSVEIKFESGQIASVKVLALDNGINYIFQNRIPIGYSGKGAVSFDTESAVKRKQYKEVRLYEATSNGKFSGQFIRLRDLLFNDYVSNLYTENYAPKDTVINLVPNEPARILRQQPVTEVLQAKIFTDVVGLDETEPNGLVQAEFDKEFYLNTSIVRQHKRNPYAYSMWLNSMHPRLLLSRLEEDNQFLPISKPPTEGERTEIGLIPFLQRQNLQFGNILHIYKKGNGRTSTVWKLGLGADIHRTKYAVETRDTILNMSETMDSLITISETPLNALAVSLGPHFEYAIRPSTNYFLRFSYDLRFYHLMDDVLKWQEEDTFLSLNTATHSFTATGGVRVSQTGANMLFFRTRLQFLHSGSKRNFFQLQVGYAFSFFSRARKLPVTNPFVD